jgi:hypothetical protein
MACSVRLLVVGAWGGMIVQAVALPALREAQHGGLSLPRGLWGSGRSLASPCHSRNSLTPHLGACLSGGP